ncbi:PilX N-terminal domain-containing pilus assembly protein [Polaromonas jejuensis]|uniref:PilX N-terminal domain-containing pilus assembly protein n=1 Tax=Polaromonas jejuensis TaxID=457502 RepID=A0ABW0QJZ0_9BURK
MRSAHRGFSLITTLILLIVVTVLGIGASQMVLLSERSTRFDRDQQIAFQAAEAALIDAEFDIRGPNTSVNQRMASFTATSGLGFMDGCGTGTLRGLCLPVADGQKPVWYSVDFTDESASAKTAKFGDFTGRTLSTGTSGIRPEMLPRYIIEVLPDTTPGSSASAPKKLFRVTAMGFGPRRETQAVLQMIFRKE